MVLASGAASSGLLGATSLTYQIVGRPVSLAHELLHSQRRLPFVVRPPSPVPWGAGVIGLAVMPARAAMLGAAAVGHRGNTGP